MSMTAKEFVDEFHTLVNRALAGKEIPLTTMIVEMDACHHRLLNFKFAFDEERQANEAASKIIHVNGGQMPPPPARG